MIKLSKAGKMPCKSFSLQAIETCPGMYLESGEVKDICKGCYATKGNYNFPVVKALRENNYQETLKDSFVLDMVTLIKKQKSKYFRWFDSGDIYSKEFLCKIHAICLNTPEVKHWIPTKSRELFSNALWKLLENLPNVTVRFSSDSVDGEYNKNHGSTVSQAYNPNLIDSKDLYQCPAELQEGKCLSCRACWSKKIAVINYIFH